MALWFFVCGILGWVVFFWYPDLLQVFTNMIAEIAGDAKGWDLFWAIFTNNAKVSILAIGFGVIAGILPLIMVGFNGFLLGYFFSALMTVQGESFAEKLLFLVGSILPHGILELPIIVLSAAVGARLGLNWVIREVSQGGGGWKVFKQDLFSAVAMLPLVIIGLFIAAIIEVFVTGYIVNRII